MCTYQNLQGGEENMVNLSISKKKSENFLFRIIIISIQVPDSEVLGVTEATGICGMEAEEKVEYEDAQEVIGEEEEVTGEFFSRLGEFSQALRADSI